MRLRYFVVDAFTTRAFHGNPAGVVPLEAWLRAPRLQQIAAENNLAETAFFVPRGDRFEIRWFTPAVEMDLCGHATLAAAAIIHRHLRPRLEVVHFDSRSGPLQVACSGRRFVLDFPSRPPAPIDPPPDLILGLRRTPRAVLKARDYLAVYRSEAEVAAIDPDFAALSRLRDTVGVIVTAPGAREDEFVSRFFAPLAGVPEDPVTGSSHCTLIPFWAKALGRERLRARQISARGGQLSCRLAGDRVLIGGGAVEYLEGHINA